jgi:hypothetical protein
VGGEAGWFAWFCEWGGVDCFHCADQWVEVAISEGLGKSGNLCKKTFLAIFLLGFE